MLSYTIADVPPDAPLFAAAAEAARRCVPARDASGPSHGGPGRRDKLAQFWNEYLSLGERRPRGIDPSMWTESTFFARSFVDQQGTFKDLMTSPYTYADDTVAAIYGTPRPRQMGGSRSIPSRVRDS